MIRYFFKTTVIVLSLAWMASCAEPIEDIGKTIDLATKSSSEKQAAVSFRSYTLPKGYIYFQQDFNFSTNVQDYIGTGTNQFTGISNNGNTSFNTLNNKLQLIKGLGSGNNRVSVTKTNHPFNPGGEGGFIRFDMEVTLSDNDANRDNGFMFSVGMGMTGTAPADPGNANVHSSFYLCPTVTDSAFVLRARNTVADIVSEPLHGTHKLIWYINNTGDPAGYAAPDGSLSSVMNDASDIWAIGEDGEPILVIDDAPALTPDIAGLQQFKISNNPTFQAILDIDDMIISEEPVIVLKKIVNIELVPPTTTPVKTIFSLLPLPNRVRVTYEDGSTDNNVRVRWSQLSEYNPYRLGEYDVIGTIIPNSGTINFYDLFITTKVTVRPDFRMTETFSPNGDGINDTWDIPDLRCYRRSSVEVLDRNGQQLFYSTDPNEAWDGKNKKGQVIPGAYYYIVKVPDLLMERKGVVTVIK